MTRPRSAEDRGRYISAGIDIPRAAGIGAISNGHSHTDRVSRIAGNLVCKGKRKRNKKENKKEKEKGKEEKEEEGLSEGDNDRKHVIERAKVPLSGQEPLLPKDGCVPVVHMVLHSGSHQALARAHMDSGDTIPLMSLAWAKPLIIPIAGRRHIKRVEDFSGADVPGVGKYYTYPIIL